MCRIAQDAAQSQQHPACSTKYTQEMPGKASEHIPSCLIHFRRGYRGNLPSPPPLPGCILASRCAAPSKMQQPTSNIFILVSFFLKHRFSAGKLVTRLCICICKAQSGDQFVNPATKNPFPLPVENICWPL